MRQEFFSTLLVLFFLVCISGVVHAQQQPATQQEKGSSGPDYQNYVVLKGGIFYPRGDLDKLNTGFNGEFAYGYRFDKNGALEIGSGYFGTTGTRNGTASGFAHRVNEDGYAIPLTLAIKGILPIDDQSEVYGLAGAGGYHVHASGTVTIQGIGRASVSDNSTVVGGFVGAGATYNITKECFLGLEGKYLWTGKASLSGTVYGAPVNED